jgi:hypothetical protein
MRSLSFVVVGRRCWVWVAVLSFLGVWVVRAGVAGGAGEYHDFLCRIPYGPGRVVRPRSMTSPTRLMATSSTQATVVRVAGRCMRRWMAQ